MEKKKRNLRVINGMGENPNIPTKKEKSTVNFKKFRDDKIEERRNEIERVLFDDQFGIQTIIEGTDIKKFKKVTMLDLSQSGISFRIDQRYKSKYKSGDSLTMRFYFTEKLYVALDCKVINTTAMIDPAKRYDRIGCKVATGKGKEVLEKLVNFLTKASECSIQQSKIFDKIG